MDFNVKQALDNCGLNWTVTQRSLVAINEEDEGKLLTSPFYGNFRDDNSECLGVGTSRYQVSQNHEIIEILFNYFGDNISVDDISGGQIRGGSRVFFKVKMGDLFENSMQEIEESLIIVDSFDGTTPILMGAHDKLFITGNISVQYDPNSSVRISHTTSMKQKLELFDLKYSSFLRFNQEKRLTYENWMDERQSKSDMIEFISKLNNCDVSLSENDFCSTYSRRKWNIVQSQIEALLDEVPKHGSTKFSSYQGISRYATHKMGGKKDQFEKKLSIVDGSAQTLLAKAWKILG